MKVQLIDSAGGDLSVVNSARVSFNKRSDNLTASDEKLITYLAKHRHDTPFRHNFIQVRCSVPLFLARQLMKHQAGLTWNEESRRYIDSPPEFYCPKNWRTRPDGSIKQGSGEMSPDSPMWYREVYGQTKNAVKLYTDMLEGGIAPEMARMVLPQNMYVNFIWSGNLLAFFHVYNLRSGEGAQEEAKEFADLLKNAIWPKFPVSWTALAARDT